MVCTCVVRAFLATNSSAFLSIGFSSAVGGMPAAIQPADSFSSSSSAIALECSFDMVEIMLTFETDGGLGAELCFEACSLSAARFGSFRVVAVELDPEDVADLVGRSARHRRRRRHPGERELQLPAFNQHA